MVPCRVEHKRALIRPFNSWGQQVCRLNGDLRSSLLLIFRATGLVRHVVRIFDVRVRVSRMNNRVSPEDGMVQSASFWHEVRYELAHLRGARKGDEVYPSRLELALLAMDASSG